MNSSSSTQAISPVGLRAATGLAALLAAMLLGAVIVFGVGFSDVSAAHNAAHDMRHANGFPCH